LVDPIADQHSAARFDISQMAGMNNHARYAYSLVSPSRLTFKKNPSSSRWGSSFFWRQEFTGKKPSLLVVVRDLG
jgi:hypothetical protein